MAETTIGGLAAAGVLSMGDGYRTKRSEHGRPGFRIIRVADVRGDTVHLDGDDFVSIDYTTQMGAKVASAGDVLLTTKGTVGRVAVMPTTDEPAVYSPQLCYFRVHEPEVVDPRFLRYWLQSAEFLSQAAYLQGNTDMAPYISLSDLRASRITIRAIGEQRAIADVLGALDDKIAANTKLATTADELASSLVRAAVLEQGEPLSIADVAEFHNRRRVPLSSREREGRPGQVPYYGANGQVDTVDEYLFDDDLVLVGEDGTVINGNGSPVANFIWGPAWVNNHAHVMSGSGVSTPMLYHLVRSARVESAVTGAVQPKLSMTSLKAVTVEVPVGERVAQLESQVGALMASHKSLNDECSQLAATRDALLPALMSGRLRVEEAAEVAGL